MYGKTDFTATEVMMILERIEKQFRVFGETQQAMKETQQIFSENLDAIKKKFEDRLLLRQRRIAMTALGCFSMISS